MKDSKSDDSFVDVMSLINHPIRVDIIKLLYSEPCSFTDLLRHLSIESTSKLSFHLNKLEKLVTKRENGEYELTIVGNKTYNLIIAFEDEKLTNKPAHPSDKIQVNLSFSLPSLNEINNRISEFFKELNPSIFIIIIAWLFSILSYMLFGQLGFYNFFDYKKSPLEFFIGWLIIYYTPVTAYVVIVYFYRLPRNYTIVGGFVTLIISLFLNKNFSTSPNSTYEGVPYENQSFFLFVGREIFRDFNLHLNYIFIFTLILYLLPFLLYIYPLLIISEEDVEFNFKLGLEIPPKWLKLFSNIWIWIVLAIGYAFMVFIFNDTMGGFVLTVNYEIIAGHQHTWSLDWRHYFLLPLGFLPPGFLIVIPIVILTYIVLNIKRLPSLLRNVLSGLIILAFPLIHLLIYYRHYSGFTESVKNWSERGSSAEIIVSGAEEYLYIHILHAIIELLVILVVVSLLLKFIVWGASIKEIKKRTTAPLTY